MCCFSGDLATVQRYFKWCPLTWFAFPLLGETDDSPCFSHVSKATTHSTQPHKEHNEFSSIVKFSVGMREGILSLLSDVRCWPRNARVDWSTGTMYKMGLRKLCFQRERGSSKVNVGLFAVSCISARGLINMARTYHGS